jgi:adenylate cyclase
MNQPGRYLFDELEKDRFAEAKRIHKLFILFSIIYVGFTFADYIYAPERILEFLELRLVYSIIPILIYIFVDKTKNFRQTEYLAVIHATAASGIISYMIFTTSGVSSPYYAGLNLVGIIALCFFTFSWLFYSIATTCIYLPYFALSLKLGSAAELKSIFVLNSFFIIGTVIVCALIHHFREYYRYTSIEARFQLKEELENRNEIILKKTEEAVHLSTLSAQFSPQVVESIRSGKIKLEQGGKRSQISSLFIDIVNSTERIARIDQDKIEKVFTRFFDDAIRILLKYDITIDKFVGDGIIAFCNAPLKRDDYVNRVINAALELREKIKTEQEFYERYWQKALELRIGIAKGYANVGFYGGQKHFRSFTAIGPVMNLASRLCSSAMPNQILIDFDVFELAQYDFETKYSGKTSLKGFEQDVIHTYEILGSKRDSAFSLGVNDCQNCGSILSLETNENGQFLFVCKSCCTTITMTDPPSLQQRQ